jgi:hypothetical protein
MTVVKYATRELTVEAVQWTGDNTEQVRAFAGDRFLFADGGRVWVRLSHGPWELCPRDWVTREPDGPGLWVHSEGAFASLWEPAGPVSTPA